jgi:RHS repeat-associated protein
VYFGAVEVRNWLILGQEQVLTYPHPAVKLVNGTTPSVATYLHRDGLSSVRAITSAAGVKVESALYKPFGEQSEWLLPGNPSPETKAWIGERYDADAGLQYLNARYYDPELSIFLQPDWFEVTEAGANRYSYCGGDPINCSDSTGNVPDNWATKDKKKGYDSSGYTHEWNDKRQESEVTTYKSWKDRDHPHREGIMDNPTVDNTITCDGCGGMLTEGIEKSYPTGLGEISLKYEFASVIDYSFGGSGQAASGDAIFDIATGGTAAGVRAGLRAMFGQAAKNTGRHIGYLGIDPATKRVAYVGRTERTVAIRGNEHIASGGAKATLDYAEVARFATKIEARIWEQKQILEYGLNNLLNMRNEIAPRNWTRYGISP